ncbi:MAG: exo-alpha-sialidase, partial [Gemmatimonadaceae bacterium]
PALSARGDTVVIAWFTGAQDSARVRFARSVDGGTTFGAPTRIDDGNPAGRVDVELVEGGAIVSWLERTTGTNAEVRVRRIHDDNSLGSMITVARSSGVRASGFPKMARRGSELIAVWTEPGDSAGVRVARIPLDRIP